MNSIQNNYLYISEDDDTVALVKFSLDLIKSGHFVLLLTQSDLKVATLFDKMDMDMSKDTLKRFTVMTFSKFPEITEKFLQLHDWKHVPTIIIVDLRKYINTRKPHQVDDDDSENETRPLLLELSFCIATLYNYLQSAKNKHIGNTAAEAAWPISLVMIKEHVQCDFTAKDVNLLINLYYYKGNAFNNFTELLSNLNSKLDEKTAAQHQKEVYLH